MIIWVLATAAWATVLAESPPYVKIKQGELLGIVETSTEGETFHSYYGIPFAKPPVGNLRLKDPVAAEGWKGMRDASVMPEICLQVPFGISQLGIKLPAEKMMGAEDCLYLNVFKPESADEGGHLPVMVFIHGGGYFSGGTVEYLPHVLLNHKIILVVLQYRLGVMGFLSTEDSVMPGNLGLKDQTMALRWVQENIAKFGGDPRRVTIFGQSAGGASVHFHTLSPLSEGLFSRGIMHSGTALDPWALGNNHKEVAETIGKQIGCSVEEGSQSLLSCLQEADARELARFVQDFSQWWLLPLALGPRVDGEFLPASPEELVKEGRHLQYDIIAGITEHDGAIFTYGMYAMRHLITELQEDFDTKGPVSLLLIKEDPGIQANLTRKIYDHYVGGVNFDVQYSDKLTQMMSYCHFTYGLDLLTSYSDKIFRYELTHKAQLSLSDFFLTDVGPHWIPHGDDLFLLFKGGPLLQPPQQPPNRPSDLTSVEDLLVRDIITKLWTTFAASGNPTPDESHLGFTWKPSSKHSLHHLAIQPAPAIREDFRQKERALLLSLPTKQNSILRPGLEGGDRESKRGSTDEL